MDAEGYPAGLIASEKREIVKLPDGNQVLIPVARLTFDQWKGRHINNTFGCKPIVDYNGKWMFAELAIRNRIVDGGHAAGWSAQWIEGRYYLEQWNDAPFNKQQKESIQKLPNWNQLKLIDAHCAELFPEYKRNSYSGCWDILAWNAVTTLFIELKRYRKDRITLPQKRWLASVLSADLMPEKLTEKNFLVIEWDFEDDNSEHR